MADEVMAFHERIRKVFLDGQWWFSVVDVVGVLTDSANPRFYWGKMKERLARDEGFVEVLTECQQLKMRSPDGKMRSTDAADTETLLRIIQSIPSPKAEPFKRWLARVGTERIREEVEPSLAEARLIRTYRKQGYSDDWIRQRMTSIRYRNGVTTEWGLRGAETGQDYAELTDTLSEGKFGITTGQHKEFKGLKPGDNLENSETIMELAIDSLGDATSITLHQARDSQGMPQLRTDCEEAGQVAGDARRQVEALTGQRVVSPINAKQLRQERQRELQPSLFAELAAPADPIDPTDPDEQE